MIRPCLPLGAVFLALFVLAGCGDDDRPTPDGGIVDGSSTDGPPADGGGDGGPAAPPGCAPPATPEPVITICPGDALPPPASGTCTATAGSAALLITGDVLTPGEVLRGGQVLVDDAGAITCVGCDCSGEAGAAGATTIVCPDGVVSPGLINAHEHINFQPDPYAGTPERYEHRHHWRKGLGDHTRVSTGAGYASRREVTWGELRFVLGGGTSINGSEISDGLLRNLDDGSTEGLGAPPVHYDTFPLNDSDGTIMGVGCDYGGGTTTATSIMGDDAYTPHVAEGIGAEARNEFLCLREGATDLVQPQSAFIHAVGLLPPEIAEMAADGTSLIWSPRSNVSLYGDTARVTEYANLGVTIALGTDWIRTGSMNMLRELRCADELDTVYFGDQLTDEQLWMMATGNAAQVLGVGDAIGTLAAGRIADIAIFDGSAHGDHRAIIEGEANGVVLVLRGGAPLYGDADVVAALPSGDACDTLDVCGVPKRACVSRETGSSLAALTTDNAGTYPLFFCGEPMNEPSCLPARDAAAPFPSPEINGSTRYDGLVGGGDGDGDGIADADDNCRCTFNPIRPMDNGAQADFDLDGIGDSCDPCPLDEGLSGCTPFDPTDQDHDTVPNATDNCPDQPNPLQEDRDGDGRGDVCDPCPDQPNPGAEVCTVSIYDVKDGTVMPDAEVAVAGGLVTAVAPNGFFMQVDPADAAYAGVDHSGVFVFTRTSPTVTRGDRVDVSRAVVYDHFTQIQLTSPTVVVTASGVSLPPAEAVAPAEVATGGTRAAALESALVRVMDVTVTDVAPAPGPGDAAPTNELEVTGGLRVDDLLYRLEPFPTVGQVLPSVTGVLPFRNGHSKLEPRDAADVAFGPPALVGLEPALSFARQGAGVAPTFPTPLTVRLTRPATTDTTITMTSSAGGLGVTDVVVPTGSATAAVPVTGVTASATPYTVTASYDGRMATADVRVLSGAETPRLIDLRPGSSTVVLGGDATLTVALDIPAPAGGTVVALSVDTGGTVPASVAVPADQLAATFDFHAGMSAAISTVTALLGTDMRTARVEVLDSAPRGLVINELDYDQPGTDTAEFLELYNASGTTLDLTPIVVVMINGSTSTEYYRAALTGSLGPGEYLVLANAGVTVPSGVRLITMPMDSLQNGAPDGVVILDLVRGAVVDALSYEGAITSVTVSGISMPFSLVETAPVSVADSGAGSIIRFPNGLDTDDSSVDWSVTTTPTPGAANTL